MIYGYFRAGAAGRAGEKSHEQSEKGGVLPIARHFRATTCHQKWSYDAIVDFALPDRVKSPISGSPLFYHYQ